MTSFVYRWTDNLTGKMYIGVHKGTEDDGYVCSQKLMKTEYLKRPQDFTREILAWFDDFVDARAHEIWVLTEANAANNPMYYNKHNGGDVGFRCEKHSSETKEKMSNLRRNKKRKPHSEETKHLLSIIGKQRKPTKETIEKQRKASLGKIHSVETKKKISLANKGTNNWLGKFHSEETKQKISLAQRGKPKGIGNIHSEDTKKKIGESNRGKKRTPEQIENMRLVWVKRKNNQHGN